MFRFLRDPFGLRAAAAEFFAHLRIHNGVLMSAIDDLRTAVQANTAAVSAASDRIATLRQQLLQAVSSNDMTQVATLTEQLGAATTALNAALEANPVLAVQP